LLTIAAAATAPAHSHATSESPIVRAAPLVMSPTVARFPAQGKLPDG
jgi:hypothetical protein